MRVIAAIALLSVAACGGEAEQKEAAPKAANVAAGQWELASEITAFRTVDQGTPAIDTPVGTRATEAVCVGAGQPPSELFSGAGYDCRYDIYYVRNGRVNVTLQCAREGLAGSVLMTVDGNFEDGSLEYSRNLRTVLAGDGDVEITARVTGRRTGECAPETEGNNQSEAQEG